MFLSMCVLAGCDYCPRVKGLGIANAHKLVKRERKPGRILTAVKMRYGAAVPEGFAESFARAFLTFQHQRIYNPNSGQVEMLHQPNLDSWYWLTARGGADSAIFPRVGDTDFLGREMSGELGDRIAQGLVHPERCVSWALLAAKMAEKLDAEEERENAEQEEEKRRARERDLVRNDGDGEYDDEASASVKVSLSSTVLFQTTRFFNSVHFFVVFLFSFSFRSTSAISSRTPTPLLPTRSSFLSTASRRRAPSPPPPPTLLPPFPFTTRSTGPS